MAKKKAAKKSTKKSHGELFDKHPNLIWLIPVFFIISLLAVMFIYKDQNPKYMNKYVDEKVMVEEDTLMEEDTIEDVMEETEELILE